MRRALAAVVVVMAGLMAPAAHATTTIGQLFTPTGSATNATVLQISVADGLGFTVPRDGVITSWSFLADRNGATVRLKVGRPNADGTYTIVGESDVQTAPGGQQSTFSTRVPVKAGDVIGTTTIAGQNLALTSVDQTNNDRVVVTAGDQSTGSTLGPTAQRGIRLDVSASIEPDVDVDGFGDETQDLCVNDPTTQTRCSANLRMQATADKRTVYPGGTVGFNLTVTNAGPGLSSGVKVVAQLSDELKLLGTDGAACSGSPITCTLGDMAKDQQITLRVVASAVRTGSGSIAAKTTSSTADPDSSANAAGASVTVAWRPGRCANVFAATSKNDVKRGTHAGDRIDGLLGNDVLAGLGGADCLDGGPGNDRIGGDDGNDRLDGGPGKDTIKGGSGNDRIDGGTGNDRIDGGAGADGMKGGSGNDRINAVDGKRDTVDCGSGRYDTVTADRGDRIRRCEKVVYAKRR